MRLSNLAQHIIRLLKATICENHPEESTSKSTCRLGNIIKGIFYAEIIRQCGRLGWIVGSIWKCISRGVDDGCQDDQHQYAHLNRSENIVEENTTSSTE